MKLLEPMCYKISFALQISSSDENFLFFELSDLKKQDAWGKAL